MAGIPGHAAGKKWLPPQVQQADSFVLIVVELLLPLLELRLIVLPKVDLMTTFICFMSNPTYFVGQGFCLN